MLGWLGIKLIWWRRLLAWWRIGCQAGGCWCRWAGAHWATATCGRRAVSKTGGPAGLVRAGGWEGLLCWVLDPLNCAVGPSGLAWFFSARSTTGLVCRQSPNRGLICCCCLCGAKRLMSERMEGGKTSGFLSSRRNGCLSVCESSGMMKGRGRDGPKGQRHGWG